MCGITGFLGFNAGESEQRSTVSRMMAALSHRGPDDEGLWLEPESGLALGHRRLSIIDLSALGHQPMTSGSGRYVITYNGEIYNFREIRDELRTAGVEFRGDSDTEVVTAAVDLWGLDSTLSRLIGMFAFALWDKQERELSLVRDRLGIKPLYYGTGGSTFFFASELKALHAFPKWSPEIDRNALAAYLRWNYVPGPQSIFTGTFKLQPGQVLRLKPGSQPHISTFWSLDDVVKRATADRRQMSDHEATDALEDVLGSSIAGRMIADVPLGAFLSGGIDSSTVVALMQARSSRPVRTFTIGFADESYDEARYAKSVAQHIGTEHTELYVEPETAREVIPKLPAMYDEPFADSSQIPTFLVSEMTRRSVTVALSGDGGDELFAGYTRYAWADLAWRHFGRIPRGLRRLVAGGLQSLPASFWRTAVVPLPASRRPHRLGERALKLGAMLSQLDADGFYRQTHTHWSDPNSLAIGGEESKGVPWDEEVQDRIPNYLERMQFMDTVTYLPDDILTKVDRASMAVSLEVRVPILDHRVVEFAWSLPEKFRVRNGKHKWLLRKLLARHLPQSLIDRPKKGFSVPMGQWLRGPLREWAEDLLSERSLARDGYIQASLVRRTWREFLQGRSAMQEPLWGILMFQAWRQHWK